MSIPILEVEQGRAIPPLGLPQLMGALSYALDLVEGQKQGHAIRSAVIGMRLAGHLQLSGRQRRDLYYALLMKDAGCSSNATRMCQIIGGDEIRAKANVKTTDWTRVSWETISYAWRNVAVDASFSARLAILPKMALNRVSQQREIVQIRCDRGAYIAREMGFSDATARFLWAGNKLDKPPTSLPPIALG